jgi:hypothetical protein
MTISPEAIKILIPTLEVAISGETNPARHRAWAMGTNCMRAAEYGKMFLRNAGLQDVRREVHYSSSMGHAFLALLDEGVDTIDMSDPIVDPTYLQFALPSLELSKLPNTFVGSRLQMIELMRDDGFTANQYAPDLYMADTWIPSKT